MKCDKSEMGLQCCWVWYPGDFEIYHGMEQSFSREERGFFWPAYWYIDSSRKNVRFQKTYTLQQETYFTVHTNCLGYVCVNGHKFKFQEKICVEPGIVKVEIFAGSPDLVPAILVLGEILISVFVRAIFTWIYLLNPHFVAKMRR